MNKDPRVVPDGEDGEAWQFSPDVAPAPIGIYASAGRKHEDVRWTGVTFAAANQGNFRAEPRLKEHDVDGVDAEVLFGGASMMSHFFSDPDPEFQMAGAGRPPDVGPAGRRFYSPPRGTEVQMREPGPGPAR